MGDNTLIEQVSDEVVSAGNINQFKTALTESHVPRNSDGVPEDEAGTLGTESIKWLKSFIKGGCWSAGDIKSHHTFDGAMPIGFGWFPCNGTIINETNYDSIFGTDAWNTYIKSSPLEGRYSPNMVSKYAIGTNNTTQDGISAITSVGYANHSADIAHDHTTNNHQHNWFSWSGGSNTITLLRATTSTRVDETYLNGGTKTHYTSSGSAIQGVFYTEYKNLDTISQTVSEKSIQPYSLEIIYYIRIV